ncbi:MFS transporter [Nakamurella leprariae]|uniref:MFS transporter n=1 Tax=Nakamurella leprariae TaxID=2803911 RepID=A0A938YHZ7_9ACTN|nr:MFS transporter [Nakamurella leprariae]MBM9468682.1 MFS transporter [Nakamurella leprariae]
MTPSPGAVPSDQSGSSRSRTERLDALPFTRQHGRLLGGSGIGWALDAMDVGLLSFVIAQLAVVWGTPQSQLSWIASAGFIGMALGAGMGGLLADRLGRRQVFAITLLVYGVATGASALAWSVGVLIALRFVVGLGLGAELPVASTLVSEYAPPRIRGRVIVILEAFWAVGWTAAALIGTFVVRAGDDGWRWALALGAVPALYSVWVRTRLPESVRFLESRDRHSEAEAAVRSFEQSPPLRSRLFATKGSATAPPATVRSPQTPVAHRPGGVRTLWTRGSRRRTGALWLVWFCVNFSYYGAFTWLPTLLVADGFSLVRSFEYTLIITLAQLPGYAVAAVLIEVWGRRSTLATFLLGSALAATFFAAADTTVLVIAAGMLLSFFNLGAWGALYAVTPEIYPTHARGTGAGWAAGVGRIASVIAPLAVPPLRELGGTGLLFGLFGAVFLIAAAGSLLLPERRGQVLDE